MLGGQGWAGHGQCGGATNAAGVCPMCDVMPEVFIQPAPMPSLLPRVCVCSDPAIDSIARCEALEELVLAVCEAGGWVGGWVGGWRQGNSHSRQHGLFTPCAGSQQMPVASVTRLCAHALH